MLTPTWRHREQAASARGPSQEAEVYPQEAALSLQQPDPSPQQPERPLQDRHRLVRKPLINLQR